MMLRLSLSLSLALLASPVLAQEALPTGWTRVARVVGGTPTAAACSHDTAFLRDWSGVVVAFDGTSGTRLPVVSQSAYGRAIAVDEANHPMMAAGADVATYDGSAWVSEPAAAPDGIAGLLALDAEHRYFVTDGAIGASDAGHFALYAIGSWRRFDAIAGRSPGDLWAVGQGGTVMHWDGHTWSREATNTDAWLHGVALGASDVWAWSDAVILHREAGGWPTAAMGSPVGPMVTVVARGASVFAVGGTGVARWAGGTWTPELTSSALGSYASFAAACATEGWLVVVLTSGDVLVRTL